MDWWEPPPPVAGPPGTAEFLRRLTHAFEYDITVRERGDRLRRPWQMPHVEEIEDGWSSEGVGWRLTGFRVDITPAESAAISRTPGRRASPPVSASPIRLMREP
jgi:hypothetical protein